MFSCYAGLLEQSGILVFLIEVAFNHVRVHYESCANQNKLQQTQPGRAWPNLFTMLPQLPRS